jgi:hypothetical protein
LSWDKRPLHELVYSILSKKKSLMMDQLMSAIEEETEEIGSSEIKDSLMKLEIWGKIDVTTEADNKRITLREE